MKKSKKPVVVYKELNENNLRQDIYDLYQDIRACRMNVKVAAQAISAMKTLGLHMMLQSKIESMAAKSLALDHDEE